MHPLISMVTLAAPYKVILKLTLVNNLLYYLSAKFIPLPEQSNGTPATLNFPVSFSVLYSGLFFFLIFIASLLGHSYAVVTPVSEVHCMFFEHLDDSFLVSYCSFQDQAEHY